MQEKILSSTIPPMATLHRQVEWIVSWTASEEGCSGGPGMEQSAAEKPPDRRMHARLRPTAASRSRLGGQSSRHAELSGAHMLSGSLDRAR